MKELNAKNDAVAFLHAQRNVRDVAIQCAESHIRNTEAALFIWITTESRCRFDGT